MHVFPPMASIGLPATTRRLAQSRERGTERVAPCLGWTCGTCGGATLIRPWRWWGDLPRNRREKVPHKKQIKLVIVCLNLPTYTSNNSMRVIIIPPVDMLPKGMLTYSYNTCQLVPSSMLTCMSPTTCMSTLLHMSTYSLTMLTCSIKYVNMLKQVCQHAFHSQHACQEFSTCQHTAPFPDG